MVRIALPDPHLNPPPQPLFKTFPTGTQIVRIFDPSRYQTGPLTFRHYGPLARFDHQRGTKPCDDLDRGIYYAALTLSSCVVEVFGDTRVIDITAEQVALITLTQPLKLLDLRGAGAMRVGSVVALTNVAHRPLSQAWSRHFYEREDWFTCIDGLIYANAHNGEDALALYERAQPSLAVNSNQVMNLNDVSLRPNLQKITLTHRLIFRP